MSHPGALYLLLTCEHAGAEVPPEHAVWLESEEAQAALRSHRGLDIGAAEVARALAAELKAPLFEHPVTRLLVDANRSPRVHRARPRDIAHDDVEGSRGSATRLNPRAFSRWTRGAPADVRLRLVETIHAPHWDQVEGWVRTVLGLTSLSGRPAVAADGKPIGPSVLHVAVHSFTPRLEGPDPRPGLQVDQAGQGRERAFDIGLLYDPARPRERVIAGAWKDLLAEIAPDWVVRRNAPYRGRDDGLPTALRRRLGAPHHYLGFELELSQARLSPAGDPSRMAEVVAVSLKQLLALVPSLLGPAIPEDLRRWDEGVM